MPTGTMFMHQTLGSLFINGDDGKYYQARPPVLLGPGLRVTFDVLNLTDAPPGFYFAGNVQPAPDPTPSTETTPQSGPKLLGPWGKPLPSTITTVSNNNNASSSPVLSSPKVTVPPSLPTPSYTPRVLTNKQTREDFEATARRVEEMDWGRQEGYGPSLQVTTKLKWEGEGRELYLRVLEEYQDRRIPGQNLFYYVGTIDVNWGKGGFRISAHTKPKADIAKSKTFSVLHIEN